MNSNMKEVEQAMTAKEKIALKFFYENLQQPPADFEGPALDGYFEAINDLIANGATVNEVSDFVDEIMGDAKMTGFIYGYTFAIERLKATLLMV